MMDWKKLISTKRLGMESYHDTGIDDRSAFLRDYDRLIFSAPFRRLQNKTQVFPLPGSIFVHNRLTHSLEVSCVGRSLGNRVSRSLLQNKPELENSSISEIGNIVSAACLAHDLGNPPFGHSGERAISAYFTEGKGKELRDMLTKEEWDDIIHFEGNANAFRLLTHQFNGRRKGGFVLTYSTIASIVKYPYQSDYITEKKKKFGFFQSEKEDFVKIADDLGMIKISPYKYARHPLVYLVEAADDICYEIMDIEDAHKMKLITTEECKNLLLDYISEEKRESKIEKMMKVGDENEQIVYLRSSVIGILVDECAKIFVENEDAIMNGTFNSSLIDSLSKPISEAYKNCQRISLKKIYHSKDVVDVEIAGYNIIYTLIEKSINAAFNPQEAYSKLLIARIPEQYEISEEEPYKKIIAVLDYIPGMTDIYALDLYQKLTGMSLPTL
jgi:dGTPase